MGKSAKERPRPPKANPKSKQDPKFDPDPIILSSDDDADEDEDQSSKIVEKAMLIASRDETTSNPSSSFTELKEKTKKPNEKKKKRGRTVAQDHALESVKTIGDDGALKGSDATIETNPSEKSHNIVQRKLIDCARAHAEKSSIWTPSFCYMCGEEAHTVCKCTANSKKLKRKRDSSTPKKEKKKKKKKKKDNG